MTKLSAIQPRLWIIARISARMGNGTRMRPGKSYNLRFEDLEIQKETARKSMMEKKHFNSWSNRAVFMGGGNKNELSCICETA